MKMDIKQQKMIVMPTPLYPEHKSCSLVLLPGELYQDSRTFKVGVYMFLGYKVDTYHKLYTYFFLSGDKEVQFRYSDCQYFTPVTPLDHVK